MTGAVVGLGLGVAVLAVNLPTADMPDREPVADAVRYTAPTERTDIVPPVVRTFTVGSTTGLPAGGTP